MEGRINGMALCAGIGGLETGIKLALGDAYRCVCFVEREAAAAAVLVRRMQEGRLDQAPVWDDITTFDGRPWRGKVHLLSGGFPCQDISCAGKGAGIKEGTRSGLFFDVMRVVRQVRPRYVFLENVSAILVRGLDVVLGALAEAGYDAEWLCLKASEVGAPHRRERFFLLAHSARDGERGRERAPGVRRGVRQAGDDVDWLDAGERDVADAGRERVPGRDGMHDGGVGGTQEAAEADGGQRQRLRDAAEHGGEPVVNAAGLGEREPPDEADALAGGRDTRQLSGGGNGTVGDADDTGRGREGPGRRKRRREVASGAGGIPYWPPGPGDRDGWAAVLAAHPELTPAIGTDSDTLARLDIIQSWQTLVARLGEAGTAEALANAIPAEAQSDLRGMAARIADWVDLSRIDRLRGLGNLVLPLQGAVALTLLMRRFS